MAATIPDSTTDAFEIWSPAHRKNTLLSFSTTEAMIAELLDISDGDPFKRGEMMVKILKTRKTYDAVDVLADNPRLVRKYAK